MTADTTAAPGTVDTAAPAATTTDAATGSATPPGSGDAPQTTDTTTPEKLDDKGPDKGADPDKPAEGVPEAYEFAMPEGMELDQGLLDKATPTFKELGLTNEQASKLVGIYAEHVKAMTEGASEKAEEWYAQRRQQEIATANEAGITAIKADKEIGGDNFEPVKQRVVAAVGAIGTPELRATFDKLGLGNDPELVRFIHRCIDYTPPDKGEGPGEGGVTTSAGDRMYRYADKPTPRQT